MKGLMHDVSPTTDPIMGRAVQLERRLREIIAELRNTGDGTEHAERLAGRFRSAAEPIEQGAR